MYICEGTGWKACMYLSHLSVTVMYGCIFLPPFLNEWQDVLIVCFCLVCVLSVFSISVSLIPCTLLFCLLKHRPHCCSHRGKAFADLFCLYCRRQREGEREGESVLERRKGCYSDCAVWQRPSPVGVGRRERRLVFCLWQSGKSCHGESLGLPSGFLRLFCSQPAFEILTVTEYNTLQP